MRRRVIALSTVAAVAVAGGTSETAQAGVDDQGDKNAQLAEAQFVVDLLTNTTLVPTDVTCAGPPATDPGASMLCYALVGDRETVAALAVVESPGVYRFVSINKIDIGDAPPLAPGEVGNDPPQSPGVQSEVDALILAQIEVATSPEAELDAEILGANPAIESVDAIAFHAPTSTLQVTVTTGSESQGVRDAIAFSVTDVMAYLWEEDEPLRDPAATLLPRLEVTVDEVVYGSSYDMMIGIADYTMPFIEWLELSTGRGALKGEGQSPSPLDPHRLGSQGRPAKPDRPRH